MSAFDPYETSRPIFARGQLDRLPKLASELVDTHPDVIVAVTNSAVAAAKNATRSIPIVMAIARDPLVNGYVKSLARPEANILVPPTQYRPVEFDHRREIIDFTVAKRIPAMHPYPEEAEEGALAAYGSRLSDEYQRPAYYVDKILKGVAPADLPVLQPTKF
jgi:ABC-type uncharacterized transport system substrate-binding protein